MTARADRIKALQAELAAERAALKQEQASAKAAKMSEQDLANQSCWQWRLMHTNRLAKMSADMAVRDVAMTYAWLRGARLADLGRLHGVTGSRVKSACCAVVRQAVRLEYPKASGYSFDFPDALGALEKAEARFNG